MDNEDGHNRPPPRVSRMELAAWSLMGAVLPGIGEAAALGIATGRVANSWLVGGLVVCFNFIWYGYFRFSTFHFSPDGREFFYCDPRFPHPVTCDLFPFGTGPCSHGWGIFMGWQSIFVANIVCVAGFVFIVRFVMRIAKRDWLFGRGIWAVAVFAVALAVHWLLIPMAARFRYNCVFDYPAWVDWWIFLTFLPVWPLFYLALFHDLLCSRKLRGWLAPIRFSLGTLTVGVLFLGSVVGLWCRRSAECPTLCPPEFWMIIVTGRVLAWSIRGDNHALARREEGPPL